MFPSWKSVESHLYFCFFLILFCFRMLDIAFPMIFPRPRLSINRSIGYKGGDDYSRVVVAAMQSAVSEVEPAGNEILEAPARVLEAEKASDGG